MSSGSLTIVGTGIGLGVHLTPEARAAIVGADELLYLAADPVASAWLERLNPNSRSLGERYRPGEKRAVIYAEMVEEMLASVRQGRRVCAAFYGHPGVFVTPSHEAIRRARDEGLSARMLPAVSAEDCLFADLGVDPAQSGCQSYDATQFLLHRRRVDTTAALILWQIGVIGERGCRVAPALDKLPVLVERLQELYPTEHEVIVYEASPYPVGKPLVERVALARLADAPVTGLATLYVPPVGEPEPDDEIARRLGRGDAASGA